MKEYRIQSDGNEFYIFQKDRLVAVFRDVENVVLLFEMIDFRVNQSVDEIRQIAETIGSILIQNPIPY
jgi:hypothetical protein